ncbi:N,N'-diacetyllegionaminic acid synthase [subsurface metagenome]
MIEKHFTLDKNLPGPDHWFSSDPEELFQLIQAVRYTEKSLGNYIIKPTPKEMEMRKIARRSIVAAIDITAGEKIAKNMIEFKRPGTGLPPKFLKYILNKKVCKKIKKNQLITFREIF